MQQSNWPWFFRHSHAPGVLSLLIVDCCGLFSCCSSLISSLLHLSLHHPFFHRYGLWRLFHIENQKIPSSQGSGGDWFAKLWQFSPEQHRVQAVTGPVALPRSLNTWRYHLDCWKMSPLANPADFVKAGRDSGSDSAEFVKLGKNSGPYRSPLSCYRQGC